MPVYLITKQTNLLATCAEVKIITKEELINIIKNNSTKIGRCHRERIRYGEDSNGNTELLKNMKIEEFESNFDPSIFTPGEITKYFRLEISRKYGTHMINREMKRIPRNELEIGRFYVADNNRKYLYLGKVKSTIKNDYSHYRNWEDWSPSDTLEVAEGFYHCSYRDDYTKLEEYIGNHVEVITSPRKFIEATDIRFEVPKNYESKTSTRSISIEFLDVN